jgi:signal transduction histidine kinase
MENLLNDNEIRVLMIDDDKADFSIISETIKDITHNKYNIEWAPTYEEGLKKIAEKRHSVYLVDYRLGINTGLDLITEAHKIGCEAPMIILTGQNDFEIDRRAMKAGASDYLVKDNINAQILERAIRYSIAEANNAKEIKKLNTELEERIKNRTKALEVSLAELKISQKELIEEKNKAEEATKIAQRASKAKTQFLSSMSHEIRTPMNAIIGFTKVMLKTELTEKQKEYLNAIKTSGDILIVLINDILDLAKVEAGKMIFEQAAFEIEQSLSETIHLLETKIQERNLKLITNFDPAIPKIVIGDKTRLRQIILNLISNSVKFTKQGQITVGMKLVKEDTDNVTIKFSVTDTGIGIPENKLETIFDNFQQASNRTAILYGGTGLGLSIVKKLVEGQSGSISVKSKINKGSQFDFTLSFKKAIEVEKEKTEAEDNVDTKIELKKVNVLVAEDTLQNQFLIKTLLKEYGFDYDLAANGKIAVEKMKQNNYDIVLMDLHMPEMSGFDATAYIRNTLHSDIPIIAITADVTTVDIQRCLDAGMDAYIPKPIDDKLLHRTIIKNLKKPIMKSD